MNTSSAHKTRWGILGTARIATKVARAIDLAPNAELIAVASRDPARAASWAAARDLKRSYGSYDALLEDPEIDAVYIPLPPSLHREWTIKAAEKSKHVLCEKPLALNAAEGREMASACEDNGVQLMDGVMWVHHRRSEEIKNILTAGTLGELRRLTAAFSFNGKLQNSNDIRVKKELGGGSLGDLGYYCIRAIIWAFDALPTKAFATARFCHGVDFNLSALLWFEGERMATFDCGFDTVARKWFEIAGTRASLVCDDFVVPQEESVARYWIHGSSAEADSKHLVEGGIQEVRMIEHFSNLSHSGKLEEKWPNAAIATMHVCDALLESAHCNQIIPLDSTP